ncbi:MAG: outer membrane beta-barrel protein [Bacteroidota bacterium]
MKKITLYIILLLTCHMVLAQSDKSFELEHGLTLGTRLDSDEDFAFQVNGYGFEGGYYFLKKIGKRGMISIDVRLAYAQSERVFKNVIDLNTSFTLADSILTRRSGQMNYRSLSLALPIRYRYQLSEKVPVFLLVGFNPYFNLSNNTTWFFDEFEYNRNTNMDISANRNQEEKVKHRLYSRDFIMAGVGYKKDRLMVDVYLSRGSAFLDNDFVRGVDKISVVLNAYYRLNWKSKE